MCPYTSNFRTSGFTFAGSHAGVPGDGERLARSLSGTASVSQTLVNSNVLLSVVQELVFSCGAAVMDEGTSTCGGL